MVNIIKYPVANGRRGRSFFFFLVVNFVIHWNETAMGLHVFPIPIPPPTEVLFCTAYK